MSFSTGSVSLEFRTIIRNQNDHFSHFPRQAMSGILCKKKFVAGKKKFNVSKVMEEN